MRRVSLIDLRRRLNSGKSPSAGLNRECAREIGGERASDGCKEVKIDGGRMRRES